MLIQNVDAVTKKNLRKIAIDVALLFFLIIVAVLLVADGKPFKRGFFCGDESLMMPYRDSTVRTKYLIMAMGLPMAVIVIVEMTRSTFNIQENSKLKLFNRDFPDVALNVLKHIGYYLFGLAVTVITTDIGKQMLGRLRPHFMEVCQPIMSDGTNCSSSLNFNRYIQDYTCGNEKTSPHILKQMKLSFPSGHASLSVFISLFTTFYLQHRMNWAGSKFLKPILQLALILSALFTSLSRISDYKHHWSDVLAGSLLGALIALITVYTLSDIRKKIKPESRLQNLESSTTQL